MHRDVLSFAYTLLDSFLPGHIHLQQHVAVLLFYKSSLHSPIQASWYEGG